MRTCTGHVLETSAFVSGHAAGGVERAQDPRVRVEADVVHVADMLLKDDTVETGKSPNQINMSGDAEVPVEPKTLEPQVRLVRACGAVPILVDGQQTSPSSTTSSPLRSSMRRQLALGKFSRASD